MLFAEENGVITASFVVQQSEEGIQQHSELPSSAIFPYCSLIFSFKRDCLLIDIGLPKKLFNLVGES